MSSLRLHNLKSAEGHRIVVDWEKGLGYVTKMYNGDRPVFNTVHGTEANALKAARRLVARRNPLPDPVYHGVKDLPPAKAKDGDTVVVPSPYKPGKYEVLIYGGDIVQGRYQEMWIYAGAYAKDDAIARAKEAVS